MIALALTDIPTLPGTTLKSENPWNDKLRMIGYDETTHDWLLSTSEGFYSLTLRNGEVEKIDDAPPVSVMGLNVMQQNEKRQMVLRVIQRTVCVGQTARYCHRLFYRPVSTQAIGCSFRQECGGRYESGFFYPRGGRI